MSVTAGIRRRRKRSSTISTAVLAVLALVVTGFALRFPGLSSSEVEVSNGGVWVMNGQDGLMGRLNVEAEELDARIAMVGEDLDILQSGYTVLETGPRGLTAINTSAATRQGMVELQAGSQVALGGDRVAITLPDGRVWVLSPEEAAAFDPAAVKPSFEARQQPTVAVSQRGTVFVLAGGELTVLSRTDDTRKTKAAAPREIGGLASKPESVALTTVGEEPVILDRENRLVRIGLKGADYDLADFGITDFSSAQLQQSSASSDHVVLATTDSLFEIPLSGGRAIQHQASGSGTPVAPAQAAGCSYGAWNGANVYVRACAGAEPVAEAVPDAENDGDLVLRMNRDLVVLNDQEFGLSWMITDKMQLVDDWVVTQEIKQDDTQEKEKESLTSTITNIASDRTKENRPPVANDDEFGARPGQGIVLPVTRNDTDPDGDVLTVSLEGRQPSVGTVSAIRGGTQLQIDVPDDAEGTADFTYKADDGRGGTDTATVHVTVKPHGENTPPQQADEATPKVRVRSGQSVSFNILPYWQDPEGDSFYLSNATMAPEDIVSFRPDGLVTINDAGLSTGDKKVSLTFRDEKGATSEGVLQVEAVSESDIPPITTADHAEVVVGRSTTLKPLVNDLNPNGGDLELMHVGSSGGLDVQAALDAGTVNVSGATAGTHYLEYTVAGRGSSSSATGLIRVDVVDPSADEIVPVAVDDLGTVTTGSETLVDPLENDVDPTGGVLVVNSVTPPEGSGLKATVIGHHLVRVEAEPNAVLGDEPVPLEYSVANSAGSATGTIRVMVARTDTQFANPVAVPDQAVVRAGDMVNVAPLSNDVSPSDSPLQLGRLLDVAESENRGHVETNEDQVRFTASDDATGEASLTYEVVDATGRTGSARISIRIVPRDAPNSPPRPENLTARTVAGTPVRIPVPTTGIDPDGDSVMLMGITAPTPTLGEVTQATGEWIEYVPHEGSVGTDSFRYQVMDRSGAIGSGEVLVGIAEPNDVNQPPYAVDDIIEVKPDRLVEVPVLENDTDPEGAPLSVVHEATEAMSEIEVVSGEREGYLDLRTPKEPGTHTVLYTVSDGQLTSTATVTIKVDPNAQEHAPIARDDFVAAADVLDPAAERIEVDVLANDSDPDGSTADLEVALDEAPDGVELTKQGVLRLAPPDQLTRVRYTITDPDDLTSAGYVWIPGREKQAPVWVGGTVKVQDGGEATIDLADRDNVRVRPGGKPAKVTDPYGVSAEHSDGSQLVKDASTLVYRPAEGFSGKDSITVEVTDGEVGEKTAATAVLQIPVDVAAKGTNLPPTLQGAMLEVEQAGGRANVDLLAGAKDPEGDPLEFALGDFTQNPEVAVAIEGSRLGAAATSKAEKGTQISVPVTVTDGTNPPVKATVQVRVTGSRKPLIAAILDEAQIDAGRTKAVDVLANDSNPFPGGKRTVTVASLIAGEGQVKLVGDKVEITPAKEFHGILTAKYSVLDDTKDPQREASGEIRVTVRGLPEPPTAPRIGEIGDGSVELQFAAGPDNGAPITGYRVSSASGPGVSQDCPSTSCTITGLKNDVEYTFKVTAINEVGESKPSAASAVARPDVRPETPSAPSAQRGDRQLTVAWSPPVNRGSAIQTYELQMRDGSGQLSTVEVDGGSREKVWGDLANGVDYSFRLRARNLAAEPSDWSGWSAPEHPAGRPARPGGKVEAERVNDPLGGGITVEWPAMSKAEANGEPITSYIVKASSGASQTVDGSKTSTKFAGLDKDKDHTFTVTGVNSVGTGAASAPSNAVTPWAAPSAPGNVKASLPDKDPNGRLTVSWSAAEGNGTAIKDYVIRWDGGSTTVGAGSTSTTITKLTNGKAYSFTVQARNRFEGGESGLSSASNSVTPYTKPAPPSISARAEACTSGATGCKVIWTVKANGDGGGGGVTKIKVKPNTGVVHTLDVNNGQVVFEDGGDANSTFRLEAWAVNGKGLESGHATGQIQSAPPQKPTSSVTWLHPANSPDCNSTYCRVIDIKFSNLDPNHTYTLTLRTPAKGGDWGVQHRFRPKADGTYRTYTDGHAELRYGYPDASFETYLDGQHIGTHPYLGS